MFRGLWRWSDHLESLSLYPAALLFLSRKTNDEVICLEYLWVRLGIKNRMEHCCPPSHDLYLLCPFLIQSQSLVNKITPHFRTLQMGRLLPTCPVRFVPHTTSIKLHLVANLKKSSGNKLKKALVPQGLMYHSPTTYWTLYLVA